MKNIAVLDGATVNPGDLSWEPLRMFGHYAVYDTTQPEEFLQRASNSQILIVNKVPISAAEINQLPGLELICVTATGYNNIDIDAAQKAGITVCNVSGYSTPSVAQHVFALILHFASAVSVHDKSVHDGEWFGKPNFSYWIQDIIELKGKNLGVYGYGTIGQEVARLGRAFGMKVLVHTRTPSKYNLQDEETRSVEQLFEESDFLSLNAALTPSNAGLVNKNLLKRMKPTAYLINTSRGGLVQEAALREALDNNWIAGAGLDVLSVEPPTKNNPLIGVKNCIITPHLAWTSKDARNRLLESVFDNIQNYLKGEPTNVIC